jgi:hypothetical protein
VRITSGREAAQAHRQPRLSRALTSFVRALALAFFAVISTIIFLSPSIGTAANSSTSKQQRPTRPASRTQAQRQQATRDYSRFLHSSTTHARRDCDSCHRIVSFEKPDIADFPDHPSCIECHRQQFFRGSRPAICSGCHVNVSPRNGARFLFPKPSAPAEFADVFPHANHIKTTSLIQFKKVIGEKSNIQATCLYCHKPSGAPTTDQVIAKSGTKPTTRSTMTQQSSNPVAFVPPAGTYMTTPTSHASCFQCHWQKGIVDHEQEPFATQCASCHRNVAANALTSADTPAANVVATHDTPRADALLTVAPVSRVAASSFLTARPVTLLARVTPKFVHEIDAHKKRLNDEGKEVAITCLQCHVAVRKATTLESLRLKENAVGLPTCSSSSCHTAVAGMAQLHLSVYRELRERAKDAKFNCALCHTPPASLAADVPCTHFAAVLASATREKKGTKGIEQLTPPRCAEELKRDAR